MTVAYQHDEHVQTQRRWEWLEFTRLDEIERNRPLVKKADNYRFPHKQLRLDMTH